MTMESVLYRVGLGTQQCGHVELPMMGNSRNSMTFSM